MGTPVDEWDQPLIGETPRHPTDSSHKQSGTEDDGTVIEDGSIKNHPQTRRNRDLLEVHTADTQMLEPRRTLQSPSRAREEASRLDDNLTLLKAERQVSLSEKGGEKGGISRARSQYRRRSSEDRDEFDIATSPSREKPSVYRPPDNPNTSLGRIFKKIHGSFWLVRYFFYITPIVVIILVPLLLGALLFKKATVGGVKLDWFCIWLEIVWLSLWAGRVSFLSCKTIDHHRLILVYRSYPNVFLFHLAWYQVFLLTTARNGEISVKLWKSRRPCFSGVLPWKYHFFPP
jgi:hypothetical protein